MAHKLVILGVKAVSAVVGGGESMKATLGFAGVLRGVAGGVAAIVKSKGGNASREVKILLLL